LIKTYFLLFLLFIVSCTPSKKNSGAGNELPATELHPYGRFIFNEHRQLELISSGVHFGFTFRGTQCTLYTSHQYKSGHNYLQYELDGVYQKRIRVEGGDTRPVVLRAQGDGRHTIWIYKATEAHTGSIVIDKIVGDHISALEPPSKPLIEFIGNSITCGAAADPSEVPCGTGEYHDQHNAYYAYGPRVARELGTEFILSSVSGIGIYRNWNSDGPVMPEVYEKTDFQKNNPKLWNFSLYSPYVVSIALGTNDFSNGDGKTARLPFDSAQFVSHYIDFVKLVKRKYPSAQIALLSSPMINGDRRILFQNCLQAVKSNIDNAFPGQTVSMYFFKPMQARGCSGHPSVEDHEILAKELIPFFRGIRN